MTKDAMPNDAKEFFLDNSKGIDDIVETTVLAHKMAASLKDDIDTQLASKIWRLLVAEKTPTVKAAATLAMVTGSLTMAPGVNAKERKVFAQALAMMVKRLGDVPQEAADNNPMMTKGK